MARTATLLSVTALVILALLVIGWVVFVIATNEFRGGGAGERTEYHNIVAWV